MTAQGKCFENVFRKNKIKKKQKKIRMLQDSYTKNISHHWVNLMLSFVLCILQRTKTQEKDHLKQLSGQFIKMSLYHNNIYSQNILLTLLIFSINL